MDQKEYWNRVSGEKEFTTPFQAEAFSRYAGAYALVADIGCGYGRILRELKKRGYRNLIGFDFSEEMIRRGKRQYPELDLRVKEGETIDLADSSTDAVILFAVLTCIVDGRDQERLIEEIHRILKPGGILYINDFLLNTDDRNLERYRMYQEKLGVYGAFELPEGAVCRHHSEEWIRSLLDRFEPCEYQRLTFRTMNGHTSNGFYYIGKKIKGQNSKESIC